MEKLRTFIKEHSLIILIVVVSVILVGFLLFISIKNMFSAKLEILVVPTDAKIMIDGQRYENKKTYESLMVKTIHVDISMEGFDSKSFDLELKKDETTKIYTYLTGNDAWYVEHKDDEDVSIFLELINEANGEEEVKNMHEKYPILSVLPIVYEKYLNNYTQYISYRIDVGEFEGCSSDFCLMITDISGGNRERALQAIRDKGFNPDDYEILYRQK